MMMPSFTRQEVRLPSGFVDEHSVLAARDSKWPFLVEPDNPLVLISMIRLDGNIVIGYEVSILDKLLTCNFECLVSSDHLLTSTLLEATRHQ